MFLWLILITGSNITASNYRCYYCNAQNKKRTLLWDTLYLLFLYKGTPPELDMAVFTICGLIRSGDSCPAIFDGNLFQIVAFVDNNNGRQNIGSSYPDFGWKFKKSISLK